MKDWNEYKTGIKATDPEVGRDITEMEALASIIGTIIERRKELGLSQRELANLCGIPQSSVARFESYRNTPNLDTIINVCLRLGLQIKVSVGD